MEGEKRSLLSNLNQTASNKLGGSDITDKQKFEEKSYKLYFRRWLIVAFFCTGLAGNGLGMMGFSPITPIIQDVYNIGDFEAQLLMLVFVLLYPPLMFPVNYIIEHKGIVIPIVISTICNVIGAWTRMLVNTNFYLVIVGQIFMAIAQPFMLTAPAKLAGLWFSDSEQALATTLGSLAQPLGAVMGFLLPLPFISDADRGSPDAKSKFEFYILIQSIIITVLWVPIVFVVRNTPPTPPSNSAEKMLKMKIENQCLSIWRMLKNRDYLMILGGFSFLFSVYVALGATVGQLTNAFGFSSKDNSIFGTIFIFAGLIGSFAHAIPLDMYQFYKYQFILIGFMTLLSISLVTVWFWSGKLWLTYISLALLGVSQLPVIGVSFAFAAEVTFPINEAHSCGFLQLVASLIASAIAAVVGILLDGGEKYIAMYIIIGAVFIGFLFTFFTRDTLLKTQAGKKDEWFSFAITVPKESEKDNSVDE